MQKKKKKEFGVKYEMRFKICRLRHIHDDE